MDKTESSVTIKAKLVNGTVEMSIEMDLGDAIDQEEMIFLSAEALMAVEEASQAKNAEQDKAL